MRGPYLFDEFFASGREETLSPFLKPSSRPFGKSLPLKGAFTSAGCLVLFFFFRHWEMPSASWFLLAVYCLSGTPALLNAWQDLRQYVVNIDVLMTLAALFSVVIGSAAEGALLLVLFEISGSMEQAVSQKTKGSLAHLHEVAPRTAHLLTAEGHTVPRSVRDVPIGAELLVRAGEIIPLDGTITAGSSFVSLAHLSGEGAPAAKTVGDEVPAGGRCIDGSLTIRVQRSNADSTLSRMIHLITNAQEAKPNVQRLIERLDRFYATTIIGLFVFFAATLPLLADLPYLGKEGGLYRALAFLVAASPCALVLATPTAYLSAISACAKRGILLKGGAVLDALTTCRVAAMDKTGTLTTGELTCIRVEKLSSPEGLSPSEDEALQAAYALESRALHPIATALCRLAQQRGLSPLPLHNFRIAPGEGAEGQLEDQSLCRIGRERFVRAGLSFPSLPPHHGPGVIAELFYRGSLFRFVLTDELRSSMRTTLEELREQSHLELVMLTGDRTENAEAVARELGIEHVHANLSPEEKLQLVSDLSQHKGLLMVGDGLNDAAALARATVGISMGKVGSATAVDASDVVFLQDEISSLPWLLHQSRQTLSIVRQNLILALAVILCATTPALLGWVPLWLAVVLHEGGTVLVGLNSLRLLRST